MRGPIVEVTKPLAIALLAVLAANQPAGARGRISATRELQQAAQPAGSKSTKPSPSPAAGATSESEAGGLRAFPGSQLLGVYDAGRGQQFYLYGTTASFGEVIAYYKVLLKQKGELIFDEPGVYIFDVGKFREDTMAFPPGITVKDYSGGGLKGYLNPKPGAQPSRFPTVVQIVSFPSAAPEGPKR